MQAAVTRQRQPRQVGLRARFRQRAPGLEQLRTGKGGQRLAGAHRLANGNQHARNHAGIGRGYHVLRIGLEHHASAGAGLELRRAGDRIEPHAERAGLGIGQRQRLSARHGKGKQRQRDQRANEKNATGKHA